MKKRPSLIKSKKVFTFEIGDTVNADRSGDGIVKAQLDVESGPLYLIKFKTKNSKWFQEKDLTKLLPKPLKSGFYWIKHRNINKAKWQIAEFRNNFWYCLDEDNFSHIYVIAIGPEILPPK